MSGLSLEITIKGTKKTQKTWNIELEWVEKLDIELEWVALDPLLCSLLVCSVLYALPLFVGVVSGVIPNGIYEE